MAGRGPVHGHLRRGRHGGPLRRPRASTRRSSSASTPARARSARCFRSTPWAWSARPGRLRPRGLELERVGHGVRPRPGRAARLLLPQPVPLRVGPGEHAAAATRSLRVRPAATFDRWRAVGRRAPAASTATSRTPKTTRPASALLRPRRRGRLPARETSRASPPAASATTSSSSRSSWRHKHIDVRCAPSPASGCPLVIVGDGPEARRLRHLAGPTVRFTGRVSDARGRGAAVSRRQALVVTAAEEFGIAAVEARRRAARSSPAGAGGVRETVVEGRTGCVLCARRTAGGAAGGPLRASTRPPYDPGACAANAARFSVARFGREAHGATVARAAHRRRRPRRGPPARSFVRDAGQAVAQGGRRSVRFSRCNRSRKTRRIAGACFPRSLPCGDSDGSVRLAGES